MNVVKTEKQYKLTNISDNGSLPTTIIKMKPKTHNELNQRTVYKKPTQSQRIQ